MGQRELLRRFLALPVEGRMLTFRRELARSIGTDRLEAATFPQAVNTWIDRVPFDHLGITGVFIHDSPISRGSKVIGQTSITTPTVTLVVRYYCHGSTWSTQGYNAYVQAMASNTVKRRAYWETRITLCPSLGKIHLSLCSQHIYDCPMYVYLSATRTCRKIVETSALDRWMKLLSVCFR